MSQETVTITLRRYDKLKLDERKLKSYEKDFGKKHTVFIRRSNSQLNEKLLTDDEAVKQLAEDLVSAKKVIEGYENDGGWDQGVYVDIKDLDPEEREKDIDTLMTELQEVEASVMSQIRERKFFNRVQSLAHPEDFKKNKTLLKRLDETSRNLVILTLKTGGDINAAARVVERVKQGAAEAGISQAEYYKRNPLIFLQETPK